MTQLLSAAFDHTVSEAEKLKGSSGRSRGAIILLVDEADALAQSREALQMHHEDRAGVNAFIRGIGKGSELGPITGPLFLSCHKPGGALDPAVKQRAADILTFARPDGSQRELVLSDTFRQLFFTSTQLTALVAATGPDKSRPYGFTYSDLTQRLIPAIVLDAYPLRPVDPVRAIEIARGMPPSPPFEEKSI